MEKTFAVTQKANGFEPLRITFNNPQVGEIVSYLTFDTRVSLVFIKGKFEWLNRDKTEAFKCVKCNHFIFPGHVKMDKKTGVRYHSDCFKNSKYPKHIVKAKHIVKGGTNGNGLQQNIRDDSNIKAEDLGPSGIDRINPDTK